MTFFDPKITSPLPGDLFVGSVGGFLGTGIAVGEILDGYPFKQVWSLLTMQSRPPAAVQEPWKYQHAGIYVGMNTVVQAEPGGARRVVLPNFHNRRYILWSTGVFPDLTQQQRTKIVAAANQAAIERLDYSVLDYGAIALHRLGVNTKWLEDYIKATGHQICSQLCDWTYQQAKYQIFDDGRWNGDVKPSDLAAEFIRRAELLGYKT
jgi:hypothetical protein